MSSRLFAFDVAQEIEPTVVPQHEVVYDPETQTNVWVGDGEVTASLYCTGFAAAYCHMYWVGPTLICDGASSGTLNQKCDVF